VIHETGNAAEGANAKQHAQYLKNSNDSIKRKFSKNEPIVVSDWVSWHYTVDDHSIYHHIPDDEIAWHAGDGSDENGGNYRGIGIEMCDCIGNNYNNTIMNTVELVGMLMFANNIGVDGIKRHYDFSGKQCPSRMMREGRWDSFVELCGIEGKRYADTMKKKEETPAKVWRVQIGAYSTKAEADKVKKMLENGYVV
jgi:N-acetylmuramoyl-L-alanine amidase CwlA